MPGEHFSDPGKEGRAESGLPVVPAIDGFRTFAIFGIVLIHIMLFSGVALEITGTWLGDASLLLPLGVDILFVVSGFVLFLPIAATGEFGSLAGYAIRRAARIVPGYWLAITVVAVLLLIAPPYQGVYFRTPGQYVDLPSVWAFIGHLGFLQTPIQQIDVNFNRGLGIDGPLWTLSVEAAFYVTLPLVAGWWFRRPWLGLVLAAAVSTAWHLAFAHMAGILTTLGFNPDPEWLQRFVLAGDYQFPAFAFAFAVGMNAAWLFVNLRRRFDARVLERWAAIGLPVSLVMVAVAIYLANRFGLDPAVLGGAPAIGRQAPAVALFFEVSIGALMVATCFAPLWQRWFWSNRLMRWLADHSYGVYLIHYPVLAYVLFVFTPVHNGSIAAFAIWCALTLPPTVLYGWLTARYFEQPIRRWARRFGRREGDTARTVGP